jgi:hypothetical protein
MPPKVLGATCRDRVRVGDRRYHPRYAGALNQVGAGRLLPLVRARLEGDDQRRPASPVPRCRQCQRFRVPVTKLGMKALTDHFAIAEDDSTHEWIRRHASPPSPRQLDGTRHRVRLGHAHSL